MTTPTIPAGIFTGVVSDILDSLSIKGRVGVGNLILSSSETPVSGFARTARAVPVTQPPAEPYALLLEAIDALETRDVLVVSTDPESTSALFGGLLATAVRQAGGAGVVVDGLVRDSREIRRLGLPTASRGVSPLDSFGRDEVVEIGTPVSIAGAPVAPGDYILADEDGFLSVPRAAVAEVFAGVEEKLCRESEMRDALSAGMRVGAAFAAFGVL